MLGEDYPHSMTGACVRMWPDENGHYKIILGNKNRCNTCRVVSKRMKKPFYFWKKKEDL